MNIFLRLAKLWELSEAGQQLTETQLDRIVQQNRSAAANNSQEIYMLVRELADQQSRIQALEAWAKYAAQKLGIPTPK